MASNLRLYGRGETRSGIEYTNDTIGRMYGIQEEGECEWCGNPLEVGDRALMLETGELYCGRDCASRHRPDEWLDEEYRARGEE